MLKTKSGIPAYDAETMGQARAEYQKFYDALAHLRHCSDYDRLLMPNIKNFLRHEIENPINPVALAANLSRLAEENDIDREHKLKEQLECDEISDAKFQYEMERIKLSRMERKAEFDKNPNLRKAIKKQKKKVARPFVEPPKIVEIQDKQDNDEKQESDSFSDVEMPE
jgi:hypothetical protein